MENCSKWLHLTGAHYQESEMGVWLQAWMLAGSVLAGSTSTMSWVTPTDQWWFSCCSVLKTLLYLCHDVVSTFFRATTDTGKRQDAFFRTRNCVLKHTYGVSSGVAIVFLSIYMGFIPSWKQARHQSVCLFCSFQTVLSRFILELQIVAWKH